MNSYGGCGDGGRVGDTSGCSNGGDAHGEAMDMVLATMLQIEVKVAIATTVLVW